MYIYYVYIKVSLSPKVREVVVRQLTHNNSFPLLTDKAKISEQTQSK